MLRNLFLNAWQSDASLGRRFINEMQNIPILLRDLAETTVCQLSSLYQTSGLKKLFQIFRQHELSPRTLFDRQ